jgi:hypothetical protein
LKEGTTAKLVRTACTCSVWNTQNRFVTWYANVLETAQAWGSTCKCHEAEYEAGQVVDCPEKGRLLPWAFRKARSVLTLFLDEANNWTLAFWGGNRSFFNQIQGNVPPFQSKHFAINERVSGIVCFILANPFQKSCSSSPCFTIYIYKCHTISLHAHIMNMIVQVANSL